MKMPTPATAISLLALCAALTTPAWSEPAATGAASLTASVKKALKVAKAADKRSRRALRAAGKAGPQGPPGPSGPAGPQGPAGPAGGVTGGAAGGDLAGSYPNPTIALGAVSSDKIADANVTGTKLGLDAVSSSRVLNNSLTGDDVNEGTFGAVPLASTVSNGAITAPKLATLTVRESSAVSVPGGAEGNGDYATRGNQVMCQAGEQAIGGGVRWGGIDDGGIDTGGDTEELITVHATITGPSGTATAFKARGGNDTDTDRNFYARVLCLAD